MIGNIVNGKIDIEKIAQDGKQWAKKNYSPDSLANIF